MDIAIAREIAARIWCDPEYQYMIMDVELAERIAVMLKEYADDNNHRVTYVRMSRRAIGSDTTDMPTQAVPA